MNFQCLSGLRPADVMTTTCTEEGNWRPDPQLLNCCMLPFIELFKFVSSFQYVVFGIAVCSATPSPPLNGSVQADDG